MKGYFVFFEIKFIYIYFVVGNKYELVFSWISFYDGFLIIYDGCAVIIRCVVLEGLDCFRISRIELGGIGLGGNGKLSSFRIDCFKLGRFY